MKGNIIAAVGVSILWGSGWLFMKLAVTDVPPLYFAAVRGVLAGLILTAIVLAQRKAGPNRHELALMVAVGVLMTGVANGTTFWGQERISSSLAALVWCGMPFFTAIFSHFLLDDQKLNGWRIGGLGLGFAGVYLVLSTQHLDAGSGVTAGKIAIVASSILWALSLVLNKRWLPGEDSTRMTGVQLLAGGLFLLPLAGATESTPGVSVTPLFVFVFLMMLFGQGIVAYLCYYYLLSRVSATSLSLLSFVTPTIAVFLGVVLLHEALYWQMFAGLAAVTVGIITVNVLGGRRSAPA